MFHDGGSNFLLHLARESERERFVYWALFSSPQKPKFFQDFSSHRILGHMHEVLDIDENKN